MSQRGNKDVKIIFFTGAGASKPSGIPTFRGDNGLYSNRKILEYVDIYNRRNPEKRREALCRYLVRTAYVSLTKPNVYHEIVAEYVRDEEIGRGKDKIKYETIVITQNVDDLHEAALVGVLSNNPREEAKNRVMHVHGKIFERVKERDNRAIELRYRDENAKAILKDTPIREALERLRKEDKETLLKVVKGNENPCEFLRDLDPSLLNLVGKLVKDKIRPDTVLFGEPVRYPDISKLFNKYSWKAAIIVIIGTSGTVYPAAMIPYDIANAVNRVYVVEVNDRERFEGVSKVSNAYKFIPYSSERLKEAIIEAVDGALEKIKR